MTMYISNKQTNNSPCAHLLDASYVSPKGGGGGESGDFCIRTQSCMVHGGSTYVFSRFSRCTAVSPFSISTTGAVGGAAAIGAFLSYGFSFTGCFFSVTVFFFSHGGLDRDMDYIHAYIHTYIHTVCR